MDRTPLLQRAYLAERVVNRLHRAALSTPKARMTSELAYRAERESHRPDLPGASQDDGLLETMRKDGIVITDLATIGATELARTAKGLAEELLQVTPGRTNQPALHLRPDRMRTQPEIFRWGASDRILDLAERYLEVPVAYHGVYLRRDLAVAATAASNQWHLDMEDRHVFKVIIYLTDVNDGDGAFEYIPRARSMELGRALGPTFQVGPDEQMSHFVDKDEWRAGTGPAGTVILADTGVLFHRGRRPKGKDRITLFYDYSSRHPWHPFYCKSAMPQSTLEELTSGMSQRVHDSVFWRPRLKEFDPIKHE
jgi:hypothetical protein